MFKHHINSYCKYVKPTNIITQISHLRNLHAYGIEPGDVTQLIITDHKRSIIFDDVQHIIKLTSLERLEIIINDIDEDYTKIIYELEKNINKFKNLYDIVIKLRSDPVVNIIYSCYESKHLLLIKSLDKCTLVHDDVKSKESECLNCYTFNRLSNTEATKCIIQHVNNPGMLNMLSSNIEILFVLYSDLSNLYLGNLPMFIKNLCIIYCTNENVKDFYSKYKHKIKLPIDCKLKIIQDYKYNYNSITDRIFEL